MLSPKISSRSPAWAPERAAKIASCSSGITSIAACVDAGAEQAVAQQLGHLVGPAAARVVVAPADVVVEVAGAELGDLADVLVAAVAGRGEHADPPALGVQAVDQLDHRLHGGRVVAVVEDHLERVLVEDVHAPRRLEEGGVEGAQAVADVVEARRPCCRPWRRRTSRSARCAAPCPRASPGSGGSRAAGCARRWS